MKNILQPGNKINLVAEEIAEKIGRSAEIVEDDFYIQLQHTLAKMYHMGVHSGCLQDFGDIQFTEDMNGKIKLQPYTEFEEMFKRHEIR